MARAGAARSGLRAARGSASREARCPSPGRGDLAHLFISHSFSGLCSSHVVESQGHS
ncbi:hypothetical protein ISF6_2074 [Piscinibacter sakaiensis]|uniref:Uncharacterized protein n=1 Tax=Piscinibacter sakaiensis TaxID=1547922 RepID=A0A0K8P121_PISS1|nr:hypothetical protein ISF6_2074 [Piscinibacter sakaiensis]